MTQQKQIFYFKPFTAEQQKRLATFEHLSNQEFDQLKQLATTEVLQQATNNGTPKNAKYFENNFCFISSTDSLQGFYCVGDAIRHSETNNKLLLIAFTKKVKFDQDAKRLQTIGYNTVAIYEDNNEKLHTLNKLHVDARPLEDWQRELNQKIKDYKNNLEGWQKVKRLYKKDGKPFENMQKNFDGCRVTKDFTIYGDFGGYNIQIYGNYLCPYDDEIYSNINIQTADQISEAIKTRITEIQKYIDETQKTLAVSEKVYFEIFGQLAETVAKYQTGTNSEGIQINYLLHRCREMIQKFYLSF